MFVSFRFDGDTWRASEAKWVEYGMVIAKYTRKLQVKFCLQFFIITVVTMKNCEVTRVLISP